MKSERWLSHPVSGRSLFSSQMLLPVSATPPLRMDMCHPIGYLISMHRWVSFVVLSRLQMIQRAIRIEDVSRQPCLQVCNGPAAYSAPKDLG